MPKKKKTHKKKITEDIKRPLIFKDEGQEYCQVEKMLGNARFTGNCFDNKKRLCIIRGTMSKRRKIWIKVGDIVLISLRDYQDDKADVIHLYTPLEVKTLVAYEELPNTIKTDTNIEQQEDDDLGIDFDFETSFENI